MALTPRQRDALILAEQRTRAEVRDRLVAYATRLWGGMGSWRDADVDRFVEQVAPRVLAGRTSVARLTDAYIATVTEGAPGPLIDVEGVRTGVGVEDTYRRPATQLYTSLSQGAPLEVAQAAALARLASLVATDLQLAQRAQARRSMRSAPRVEAFRRTLTGGENCALCVIASTQRYWKGDLLPIHPGCDCGVEPLGRSEHRDQVINRSLLESTHDQIASRLEQGSDRAARWLDGSNPRSDYLDLIVTRDHGEYGPTLAWRGQHFTGPGDIAA